MKILRPFDEGDNTGIIIVDISIPVLFSKWKRIIDPGCTQPVIPERRFKHENHILFRYQG